MSTSNTEQAQESHLFAAMMAASDSYSMVAYDNYCTDADEGDLLAECAGYPWK